MYTLIYQYNAKFRAKLGSVIPSGYSYNRNNEGVKLEGKFSMFEFLEGSIYKYLGKGYPVGKTTGWLGLPALWCGKTRIREAQWKN
jgi:hypothetical protein